MTATCGTSVGADKESVTCRNLESTDFEGRCQMMRKVAFVGVRGIRATVSKSVGGDIATTIRLASCFGDNWGVGRIRDTANGKTDSRCEG